MSIVGIPEAIHDFNMYLTANRLAGVTGEVQVPDLEAMTATISGTGILGEYEAPIPGHFGSIVQEIPFRCINEDYFKMVDTTKALELMLRGSIQYNEQATQAARQMGMRIVYRGKPKVIKIGTVRQRGSMDSSISLELTYILIEMDGKPRIELDKTNGVWKKDGVDMLAEVRQYT